MRRRKNRRSLARRAVGGLGAGTLLWAVAIARGQTPADEPAAPAPTVAAADAGAAGAAEAPADPAAAALQEQLEQARRELLPLGERLARLGNELGALSALLRERTGGPEEPAVAEEIRFRPPLLRETSTKPIFCLCRNDRVYVVGASDALVRAIRAAGDGDAQPRIRLSGADVELQKQSDAEVWQAVIVGEGESADEAPGPGSRWRDFLSAARLDPEDYNVQFDVYGDSFAAFRAARQVAWDLGFETGWLPRASDADVIYSQGGGSTTVQ